MNISRFFVDRPIFAAVLSLLITVVGALSLFVLPISEYPRSCRRPSSSAAPIRARTPRRLPRPSPRRSNSNERRRGHALHVLAVDRGRLLTLTVTFKLGTDLDKAQVQVQNRVAQALPRLPRGSAAHRRD